MKRPKLILGDAIATMKAMKANSVDLITTDPPYRVISGGNKSKLAAGWNGSVLHKNDGKIFQHNSIKCIDYMRELYRVLKPGRDCYVMTNNITLHELLDAAKAVGFKFHNLLRWDKNTKTANRWYMADCEYTLYFYKPPARRINNAGSSRGFFAKNPRNKRHPTEKPVKLFKHYIDNSSEPGWVVLDPFLGSGAAALAAIRSGRQFIGIEIDDGYMEIAAQRVSKLRRRLKRKAK